MDFGATPNIFTLGGRHVVGAGGKDGVYYALDAQTGEKIWSAKLAMGGNFGGFYGTVVDGDRVYLTNAIGEVTDFQGEFDERKHQAINYGLDARTGNLLWRNSFSSGSVGQNSGSPGIYFTGGLDHQVHAYDGETGQPLISLPLSGASSSVPVVAGGELFTGAGTGATYRAAVGDSDILGATGIIFPHPIPVTEYGQGIYAFCLASDPACAERLDDPESAKRATVLEYDGATTGDYHDPATMSATLREAALLGAPVEGATVTFTLGDESCEGVTDAAGKASCQLTPDVKPGEHTVEAVYEGDDTRRGATDSAAFTVTKEQTGVAYTGPATVSLAKSATLSAELTEDDGAPVADRKVVITLGTGTNAQSCTATTGADGTGSCTIKKVSQKHPLGPQPVTVSFAGDDFYHPSEGAGTVTVVPSGRN